MSRPLRPLLAVLAVLLAAGVAACGGEPSETEATAGSDPVQLLADTFANRTQVASGRVALDVAVDGRGRMARELGGPVSLRLAGPFERQEGRLPAFKLDLAIDGAGQTLAAGATSTGEQGFVNLQGTDYALSDLIYRQLQAGYEQAHKEDPAGLGLEPQRWVTDPVNAGEARVGDEDTIKVTGGVDVARMLDDVDTALAQASALGLPGHGGRPSGLTERHKRHIAQAVEKAGVEVYTGRQDRILRRLVATLDVEDPDRPRAGGAAVKLDLSLTALGEEQAIEAPSGARPFQELQSRLGTLGLGAPGGAGARGSDAGKGDRRLQRYSDCVKEAGGDRAKERRCADLLTGP
jgi:hypothetical protein